MLVPLPNAAHPAFHDHHVMQLHQATGTGQPEVKLLTPGGLIVVMRRATVAVPFAWAVWVDQETGRMVAGNETGVLVHPELEKKSWDTAPVFLPSGRHINVEGDLK